MRNDPKATFTFGEAVNRTIISDDQTLEILAEVVSEERHLYCLQDLESLAWIFSAKRRQLEQA